MQSFTDLMNSYFLHNRTQKAFQMFKLRKMWKIAVHFEFNGTKTSQVRAGTVFA